MIFEIIEYGSILFWLISAGFLVALLGTTYNKKGTESTMVVVSAIAVLVAFTNIPVLHWIQNLSTLRIVEYIGGYLLAGITYMILKWIYEIFETKCIYLDYREKWLKKNNLTEISWEKLPKGQSFNGYDSVGACFANALSYESGFRLDDLPPKISKHKGDLVFWASYWPLSLIFTLLGNPLRHLVNFVINLLTTPMNKISAAMFNDITELKK